VADVRGAVANNRTEQATNVTEVQSEDRQAFALRFVDDAAFESAIRTGRVWLFVCNPASEALYFVTYDRPRGALVVKPHGACTPGARQALGLRRLDRATDGLWRALRQDARLAPDLTWYVSIDSSVVDKINDLVEDDKTALVIEVDGEGNPHVALQARAN
jgi:hypothetical protein